MEVAVIVGALEPEVFDAVWAAVKGLLAPRDPSHLLGCHRPRISDRVCFRGVMIRLVTGASWVDVEAIMDFEVSDTTLRARRDEWVAAADMSGHATGEASTLLSVAKLGDLVGAPSGWTTARRSRDSDTSWKCWATTPRRSHGL